MAFFREFSIKYLPWFDDKRQSPFDINLNIILLISNIKKYRTEHNTKNGKSVQNFLLI